MTIASWFVLFGILMLSMGFLRVVLNRLPITSSMFYLAVGILVGPTGFALFHFNPLEQSEFLEILTECAVLISLFAAGVKMPVPVSFKRWRGPVQLAFFSMLVTVALVAAFSYFVLQLPLGAAILLGAIIAPTDPVLATDVQVRHHGDKDQLRFALTCEAGMNDGTAFPFVMLGLGLLGLHELGDYGTQWFLVDVIWATISGLGIGVLFGCLLGYLVWYVRTYSQKFTVLHDFLGLGLIATVYGVSLLVDAWGFLAVFAAAVALRQTEISLVLKTPSKEVRAELQNAKITKETNAPFQHLSEGSLIFNEHLERLSELVLVILLGGTLFIDSWSWRALGFSAFVFLVARPLSVYIGLWRSGMPMQVRGMSAWFGVRGIGSLYYLMYAIQHGLPQDIALELIHVVFITITLSIFIHGVSVKPLVRRQDRSAPKS
jgi:NhaP-type Na+/H+ or K+/H+ antiporter